MRKALIAVIAAAVLFAVGAFAADLAVNSDDVASGEAPVGACGDANVISWATTTAVTDSSTNTTDWQANGAQVRLIPFTGSSCLDADVDIAIFSADSVGSTAGGWTDGACQDNGTGADTTADDLIYACAFTAIDVRPIERVAVLVNGNSVTASTPGG